MKIELDHAELQSILEHLDQDKARMHQKIRLVLEPFAQMTAKVAGEHLSGPQAVADPPADEDVDEGAEGDDEPATGTQG